MSSYTIYGAEASPYSVKMRAVMRYKRLPHVWAHPRSTTDLFTHVKAPVIPVLRFPDGSWRNDSTPVIRALEAAHPERAVVPEDEADAFLCWLLEDMADEWGTKIMFHERWAHEADRDVNARSIVGEGSLGAPEDALRRAADAFRERQVGRMALVGCTPANAPVIERSERAVLEALDRAAADGPWLFGSRPSAADFAWHGQLWQLLRDPTPRRMLREAFPSVFTWLEATDDASAVVGSWRAGSGRWGPAADPPRRRSLPALPAR
jgi:glutathione S-transferase